MAKKVSKNQRTQRGGTARSMAKIVMAEKKPNGAYRFKERVVEVSEVQEVLREAKA